MPDIDRLDLAKSVQRRLRDAGVGTLDDLSRWNRREIGAIRGIGPKTVADIEQAANGSGIQLAADPLAPYQCVREGRDAWDVRLSSFFLCDDCIDDWTKGAFRYHRPSYSRVLRSGTCQNCNRTRTRLRLAQWFLCGNCERVARSIGRSIAAEEYVVGRFDELFANTGLRIVQLDHPVLRVHYAETLKTKIPTIDFAVCGGEEQLAGIELKTGRSHLGGWAPVGSRMNEFQLDHGDCDDISAVAKKQGILVYLFHAQVIDRAEPPATRHAATGLWWIDPFSLSECYRTSRTRPRETKTAAYFSTGGFRPFEEFRGHWECGDLESLRDRFAAEGQPPLYGHSPS